MGKDHKKAKHSSQSFYVKLLLIKKTWRYLSVFPLKRSTHPNLKITQNNKNFFLFCITSDNDKNNLRIRSAIGLSDSTWKMLRLPGKNILLLSCTLRVLFRQWLIVARFVTPFHEATTRKPWDPYFSSSFDCMLFKEKKMLIKHWPSLSKFWLLSFFIQAQQRFLIPFRGWTNRFVDYGGQQSVRRLIGCKTLPRSSLDEIFCFHLETIQRN